MNNKIEQVFDKLVELCPNVDYCGKKCLKADREKCYRNVAQQIDALYTSPSGELMLTDEYIEAVHYAELGSPTKGKQAIDNLFQPIIKRATKAEMENKALRELSNFLMEQRLKRHILRRWEDSMTWFNNHLNVSLLLAWLVGNGLVYLGQTVTPIDGSFAVGWLSLYILAAIVILGTEIWYLHQKRCSYFYLFYNLLWIFGLFALLTLKKKEPIN